MADDIVVQRSIRIAAGADEILTDLVDFRRWREWSPWEGLDPELKRTYSGPEQGVGAQYEWSGNRKAGAGRMRIDSADESLVDIDLLFTRPFKSSSRAVFQLVAGADTTEVQWRIVTPKTRFLRIFGFMMNLDKSVGSDLELGLANLKNLHEA